MITFIQRDKVSKNWIIIAPILSIVFTIFFGLLIFTFLGYNPLETLYQIFVSPFSRIDRISDILVKACPLIIIGTGLMLCFKSNVWNIGAEGQFIMGALLAGSIALSFPNIETKFFLLITIFAGFVGGAIWAFIPAILKTKLNVNEILVSLMLVYVAMLFIDFIVRGPLRDPMSFGFPLSKPYPEGALINKIPFPGIGFLGQLHYGILFVVLLIPVSWIFVNKTLGGFKINVLGSAPQAAKFAGFKQNSITITVLLLSGGLAGVAGVIEVSANIGQLQPEVSFGYGFTAIIVAFLGRLNPVGILFAGVIIATVKLGADNAQMTMGIPKVVTGLFEGILLFFLLTGETLQKYKIKWSEGKKIMDALILTIIATSIPLLLAAAGELIAEKSGILNLGVEGMMLSGAVGALGAVLWLENPYYGIVAGALSGVLMASIFSVFTINFMTNQVATGLGLTIFATGLTGLAGAPLVGKTIPSLPKIEIFLLSDIPLIGSILFKQDFVAYLSIAIIIFISFFLKYSKSGIILRAVGDDHQSAHSVGYPVKKIRWYATCFGGMCAGIGGAYIPLVLTPHWSEGMTAGRGWIALALVVFASWIPWRIIVGALLFGGITIAQLVGQARGWPIPSQLLSMMPYIATIIALTMISGRLSKKSSVVPASLGKPFFDTK